MLPAIETESLAMVLRILRLARPAGAFIALATACTVASACSNNPPAVADAYMAATVGVSAQDPNTLCALGSVEPWVNIGVNTSGKPTTVQDGSSQSGYAVHVTCTVATSGNGFDISLNAELAGISGGSITITSPQGQGAVTASGGSNISAVFQSGQDGTFSQQGGCSITFQYNGATVPDNPPIAAGRIWGHISCPTALDTEQTVPSADGGSGSQPRQCDAEADFLFEQCGQ
jgi:hypothetical protein